MNSTPKIFVTGVSGFIGKSLILKLIENNFDINICQRSSDKSMLPRSRKIKEVFIGDLIKISKVSSILFKSDIVIHLAGRAHVMNDTEIEPLSVFRKSNTETTLALALQAADAGVKRFIFISSIKVNGETTQLNRPFKETDINVTNDPYGLSKYEAEQGLIKIGKKTGMEIVIIRPPLVYGANAKGNFARLVKLAKYSIPLPFGAINNKRSLIALDNLVDFIIHCTDHPKAANEVFLISDNDDVSTTQLLNRLASAFGKKNRLIPVPVSWMMALAMLLGKQSMAEKLFCSLQVDIEKAKDLLGWQPITTMSQQLAQIAKLEYEKTD